MKLNLKGVPTAAWVRSISLLLVLFNQVSISFFKFELLPFDDATINEGVSTILTVVVALIAGWKDQPFTKPAQEANAIMKQKKKEVK